MREFDVFVFLGQSNMQGQAEGLPEANPSVEGAFEYRCLTDTLVPLAHPVGETVLWGMKPMTFSADYVWDVWDEIAFLSAHNGGASLAPYFANAYVKKCGRGVIAVHCAKGATRIAEWTSETKRFDHAVKKTMLAVEKARSQGIAVKDVYVLWFQGESDAEAGTPKSDYKKALTQIKNAWKKAACIRRFGIVRVGNFAMDERDDAIQSAQDELCVSDADFFMATRITERIFGQTEMMNPDAFGHFGIKGLEAIGNDAGKNFARENALDKGAL